MEGKAVERSVVDFSVVDRLIVVDSVVARRDVARRVVERSVAVVTCLASNAPAVTWTAVGSRKRRDVAGCERADVAGLNRRWRVEVAVRLAVLATDLGVVLVITVVGVRLEREEPLLLVVDAGLASTSGD